MANEKHPSKGNYAECLPRPEGDWAEKGTMALPGKLKEYAIGYVGDKMPDPDSLPRTGRYGRDFGDGTDGTGNSSGMPTMPPRSGYFGSKQGGKDHA